MKDIIITSKRQRTELWTILVCFLMAFALNVYAIISYDGQWNELFWSLGFVAATTVLLYAVWTLLRLLCYGCKKLFNNKNK